MSRLGSSNEENRCIVLDASVLINILASGKSFEILSALGYQVLIPTQVFEEVKRNPRDNTDAQIEIRKLVETNIVSIEPVYSDALITFIELTSAPGSDSLGDGEAATLSIGQNTNSLIAIDEKKATRIAQSQFPHLQIYSSVDLFSCSQVTSKLPSDMLADAIFDALFFARMRVPANYNSWIQNCIGAERAAKCTSLKQIRSP